MSGLSTGTLCGLFFWVDGGERMTAISLLAAAFAPSVALLIYFYLKDYNEPEPFRHVCKMFLVGVLIVLPTLVIQRGIILAFGYNDFWFAFFISGAVEEFVKWFFLYHMIYHHPTFDKPYDAIVYAVAISLGFATLENVIYLWSSTASLATVMMKRVIPVFGHALFGVAMGYYVGKAKFYMNRNKHLFAALIIPIFWHGLYDYILLSVESWAVIIAVFMVVLWLRSLKKVSNANHHRARIQTTSPEDKIEM